MSDPEVLEVLLEEEECESESPKPVRSRLRRRYLHERLSPATRLTRSMLWSACPAALLCDIEAGRTGVVAIEVPARDWSDLLFEAARSLFGSANFISRNSSSKASTNSDLELRVSISANQFLVVIAHQGLDGVGPATLASLDYHVRVPFPSRAQIAATIRATYPHQSARGVPKSVGKNAPAGAVLAAIRPNENAARAISRLITLDRSISGREVPLRPGPTLADLHGYGALKIWGLELADDIRAFRDGKLEWSAISSAAVLYGPPGGGKTFFASALARSCNVPLVATNLGTIFQATRGYLHEVVQRMSDAFDEARGKAPAVLFIDELDSIPDRATLDTRHRDYWTTFVNHLLKLIDDGREGVVVLGATNMIDRIDSAILRAGRLERHFEIKPPNEGELAGMFRYHLGQRLADLDLQPIARLALGSNGAQVELFVRTAIAAARREGREVEPRDLLDQLIQDDLDADLLRRVSIHEAGHAVAAFDRGRRVNHLSTLKSGPNLARIEFAGPVGGTTRKQLEDQVVISLAGRAAELIVLGDCSAGARADLAQATETLACVHGGYGMGSTLVHRLASTTVDLLCDVQFRDQIEADLRILEARANAILTSRLPALQAVAEALRVKRVLAADEFLDLVRHDA